MKTYGLIGKNISYSFSRAYFSEKFEKEKIDAHYLNFDINSIQEFPKLFEKWTGINGLNVTIPYKQKVIPFLDELDPVAREIGAVNTVKIIDGKKIGYNTDYYGFLGSLKPFLSIGKISALILSTGGASLAVAYALKKLEIPYQYVSRSRKKANLTYADLTGEIMHNHQLIVNCTPLGTSPNVEKYPHIPMEYIGPKHLVYDLIYNPPFTRLMKLAAKKGAKVINGQKMLELQAEKAWQIWNSRA